MIVGCAVFLVLETGALAGTEKITKEVRETVDATKEYTAQQKEAFQQKAHEELIAIQKQVTALQDKARNASVAARADLQESINELEKKKEAAREKLATLRVATDEKWNAVKSGVDAALDDVKSSYRKALSHLP
jgi:transketolase